VLNNSTAFLLTRRMKLTVDLTTSSTVFYPLGPQGQWINHRFGRRKYPNIELDFHRLIRSFDTASIEQLTLSSVYGDPMCYSMIEYLLEHLLDKNVQVEFHSYLNHNHSTVISLLNQLNAHVTVNISGTGDLCNKVHLSANWDIIKHNLIQLTCKKTVVFHMYQHNLAQIPLLKEFCQQHHITLVLVPGIKIAGNFSSVIDEQGNWLYDVFAAHNENDQLQESLVQTVEGYHALKKYYSTPEEKSILEKPLIFKMHDQVANYDEHVSVSCTGHVFKNVEHMHVFANALCRDWRIKRADIFLDSYGKIDQYMAELSALLNLLATKDYTQTIHSYTLNEILSSLSDSNV